MSTSNHDVWKRCVFNMVNSDTQERLKWFEEGLDSNGRPIGNSIELIQAYRKIISYVMEHEPKMYEDLLFFWVDPSYSRLADELTAKM